MGRKKRKELNRRIEELGFKGKVTKGYYGSKGPEFLQSKEVKLGGEESVRKQPKFSYNLKEKKKVDEK
ncbi:MAG: hypothetical protein ACFFD2_10200 [Promethearchaeota archaeon]